MMQEEDYIVSNVLLTTNEYYMTNLPLAAITLLYPLP